MLFFFVMVYGCYFGILYLIIKFVKGLVAGKSGKDRNQVPPSAIEHVCTCNYCNAKWVVSGVDEKVNQTRRRLTIAHAVLCMLSPGRTAIDRASENATTWYMHSQIVDYGKCPRCGSRDIATSCRYIGT